ncbi:MAG: O-antigen ligase [Saprospiraceae bacterium]|jgi:O-antigen ligase
MERLLNLTRQQLAVFICGVMIVALIYSKFLLTIGMILLLLISLLDVRTGARVNIAFNPELKHNFRKIWWRKDFLVVSLFFLLVLFSGIYSTDLGYLGERLRIKLPFLLLPFAFIGIPPFSERQYLSLFYLLILVVGCSAIPVGINYWLDYEHIHENMQKGQTIPTPMNHIRYSLLIAFSVLSGAALWWKGFFLKYKQERYLIAGITIFLFFFLHILSVRSGLLVLYISILFLSLRFMFLSKQYLLGLGMIGGLALFAVIALKTVPSLQAKVNYMHYDFEQYLKGNHKNYSDAERFISMEAGLKIGNRNPLIGVGAGDLKAAVKEIYEKEYPDIPKPKMPHNQFLSVYAGTGILGLSIFLFAFFFPLCYRKNYQDVLFTILHVIVFCSFFIENTIETAIGVAFYVLFLMIGLNRRGGKSADRGH